jgi:hypothetical protein
MKTMYYLQSETRQKINDFHREKADDRLRETATVNRSNPRVFDLVWKTFAQLAHLPQCILRSSQHREQSTHLEHLLDEA